MRGMLRSGRGDTGKKMGQQRVDFEEELGGGMDGTRC